MQISLTFEPSEDIMRTNFTKWMVTLACPIHQTPHPGYMYVARCTRPAFTQLCSMVAKRGDQKVTNCGSSAAMTMPWPFGSVASKTGTKHPQLHYYRNLASSILHSASQMVWPCTMGHIVYQIYRKLSTSGHWKDRKASEDMTWIYEDWCR